MSKPKFTPDTWRFARFDGRRNIVADDGELLMHDEAYCPACPSNDDAWFLIAAAPALYAALLDCVKVLEIDLGLPSVATTEVSRARAALAAARGEK